MISLQIFMSQTLREEGMSASVVACSPAWYSGLMPFLSGNRLKQQVEVVARPRNHFNAGYLTNSICVAFSRFLHVAMLR